MDQVNEYYFSIDAFTPETMPMSRLAEYMADLARLIGEERNVHFRRLDKGSAVIVHWVDPEAAPKVRERVSLASLGKGPAEPLRAIQNINRRLEEDSGSGLLLEGGAEIIRFPGREVVEDVLVGLLTQPTTLEGLVIRIGGTQNVVPVHLSVEGSGVQSRCFASRDTAKLLAQHIFGPELRVAGPGTWLRTASGNWMLDRFVVQNFDVLERRPLAEQLADLRSLDTGWSDVADPWTELSNFRHGGDAA